VLHVYSTKSNPNQKVFTISSDDHKYRLDRHLPLKIVAHAGDRDSDKIDSDKMKLEQLMGSDKFRYVCLDYFYIPNGYLAERLQGLILFLMETLVQFFTKDAMIDLPLSDDIVNLIKANKENKSERREAQQ